MENKMRKFALVKIIMELNKVKTEIQEFPTKAEANRAYKRVKRRNAFENVYYSVSEIRN